MEDQQISKKSVLTAVENKKVEIVSYVVQFCL